MNSDLPSNTGAGSSASAVPLLPPRPPKSSWEDARLFLGTAVKEWPTWFLRRLKVVAHYGFVPLVIAVGMTYEPRPHILQLIGP